MADAASALQRLPAHGGNVGGLPIRRALPTRGRRLVGAWCFLDHAGPAELAAPMRVGPHPHIGLQTFTWMIEGEVLHRDSLGITQVIRPGQVNLMTAGRGISHSEESLPGTRRLQLAQLWIALPQAQRHAEPAFVHHPRLPAVAVGGYEATVLVGTLAGARSPVEVHTPLLGADLHAAAAAEASVALRPDFEHALLVLEGELQVEGEVLPPGELAYLAPGRSALALRSRGPLRVLLLGGEPFTEPVLLWWNFVARSVEELVQATDDWRAGRGFGEVRGYDGERLVAPDPSHVRPPAG